MSRYDWPAAPTPSEEKDDPAGRTRHNARRLAGLGPVHMLTQRPLPPAAPAPRPGRPRAPASSDNDLWQPLGPATLLNGQAEGSPRVCGRVNALAVHPDGQRAYAAAANGGVWATTDGGASWRSVGGLAETLDVSAVKRPAHRNSCGAIHVVWRSAGDGGDLVLLGTGEPHAGASGRAEDGEYGLGVYTAIDPAANLGDDPWSREAPLLVNDAVYAFTANASGSEVYAATRTGLYQRPAGPPAANKAWTRITVAPFDQGDVRCTAVLYTPEEADDPANPKPAAQRRPGRLWVWVQDGAQFGLWVRTDGNAGFTRITENPVGPAGVVFTRGRGTLAAAPRPTKVWLLLNVAKNVPPGLFEVPNPVRADPLATALAINGMQNILGDQGWYDIALAVDPSNENRVAMAGNFYGDPNDPADAALVTTLDAATRGFDGSILIDTVVADATPGQRKYGATAGVGQFIGMGVHPDVHALVFSNNGTTLWTGCDGGVYRSDRLASSAGFYPRNTGLSISETNYMACHPLFEGDMLSGLQDNGTVERLSGGVWKVRLKGDGGGLMIDPLIPGRWFAQYVRGDWTDNAGSSAGPLFRGTQWAGTEKAAAAFYSQPATVVHQRGTVAAPAPVTQMLIGTDRLWYTENAGANWVTLPTATDPLPATIAAPAAPVPPPVLNTAQDNLGEAVVACRWSDPDTAWVLTLTSVHRFDRTPGTHVNAVPTWTIARVVSRNAPPVPPAPTVPPPPEGKAKKADPPPPPVPPPADPAAPMFKASTWTEIEPNFMAHASPAPPTRALYLGTTGHPDKPEVDTLWWYDADAVNPRWWPTGLRSTGHQGGALPATVTSIAVDPARPDEVWVGTNVGVFKGTRTAQASPPAALPWTWAWEARVNGLPEASVEDLAIFRDSYTDPDGLPDTVVLLRAAIGARGIWELRLDQQAVPAQTYLRVHGGDLRHRTRARLLQGDGTSRSWHASPDIRPRPRPTTDALPKPQAGAAWWRGAFDGKTERLRRFQAALRHQTGDVRIVGNGIWDGYFSELLREHGAPLLAQPPAPQPKTHDRVYINATFWDSVFTGAHRTAEPWGPGRPTEADLLELTAPLPEGSATKASAELKREPWRVEIVVHHRGRQPRAGSDVRVTLLYWIDPAGTKKARFDEPAKWAPGPIGWAAAVNNLMNAPTGASVNLPSGWRFAGTTDATRRVDLGGQTLDPFNAGIASFDLSIPSGVKTPPDCVVLLVAVIRAGNTPLALPAKPLQDLVLEHDHVALRAVRIV